MPNADIPPSGIRLIRETRGETREEFAEVLAVTRASVGNWERGDAEPRSHHQEALIDAIPESLSTDEVFEAEDRLGDDPRAFDNEKRLFGSDRLQELRECPRTTDELEELNGLQSFSAQQRLFVERLRLAGVRGGAQRDGESVTTVYYLAGDERRALRRFIEANEQIVRAQLADVPNRFSRAWDEWHYGLLEEEWRFYLHE